MDKNSYNGLLIFFMFFYLLFNVSFGLNISKINKLPEQIHEVWYAGIFKYMVNHNGDYIYNPDYSIGLLNSSNISFVDPEKMTADSQTRLFISSAKTKARETMDLKRSCNAYFYFRENNKMGLNIKQSSFYNLGDDVLSDIYGDVLAMAFLNNYMGLNIERYAEYDEEGNFIRYDYKLKTIGGPLENIAITMLGDVGFRLQLIAISNFVPFLRQPSINLINSYDSCYLYSSKLEDSLNNMYLATESSAKAANLKLAWLIDDYYYLEFLGFCDPLYSSIGRQECIEELSLLEGIETGTFINFVKAKKAIDTLNTEAYSENTDYSKWPISVEESWNFIKQVDSTKIKSENSVNQAIYFFDAKRVSISEGLILLSQRIKEVEQDELNLIDGIYLNGNIIQQIETVKSKVDKIKLVYANSQQDLQKIDDLGLGFSKGWLAKGLYYEDGVLENITNAVSLSNQIKEDAQIVVLNMKKSAADLLKEAKNKGYSVTYEEDLIKKGDSETKTGKKFYYYKEAFVSLVYALSENNQSLYSDYNYYITYLPNILDKASDDGINVDDEKSLLQNCINTKNTKDAVLCMKNIERRVVSKAQLQFKSLENYRNEINEYIQNSQGYLDYLKPELAEKETGIIFENRIDYKQGLGRLKQLNNAYLEIIQKIEKEIQKISVQMLRVSWQYGFDTVEVDKEMHLEGMVNIYNPSGLEIRNAIVNMYVPFEASSINSNGIEVISYKNCIAELKIDLISPFERKSIAFEKNGIFAKKYDIGKEAFAYMERANITEKFYIQSFVCIKKLKLQNEYDNIKNANLLSKKIIIGEFKPDYYNFEAFKTINNAYEYEKSDFSSSLQNQGTVISYKLIIKKNLDLDYILYNLEKNASVSSATTSKYSVNKDILKIDFPDSSEVFYISYLVKDIESEINRKVNKIKKNVLTSTEQGKIDEIGKLIQLKDFQTALENVNILEQDVEKRLKKEENSKATKDYLISEISRELNSIEEAENYSNVIGITLPDVFLKKKENLIKLLQMVESNDTDNISSASKAYEKNGLEKMNEALASEYFKRFVSTQKEYSSLSIEDSQFESLSRNFTLFFEKHKADKENSKTIVSLLETILNLENKEKNLRDNLDSNLNIQYKKINDKIIEIEEKFSYYKKIYESASWIGKISIIPENIQKKIDKIKSTLEKNPSEKLIADLEKIENEMNSAIDGIYELAYLEIEKAKIELKVLSFDDKIKATIEIGLEDAMKFLDKKEIENALPILKNSIALLKKSSELKKEDLLFDKNLIIAGILILAIGLLYFNEVRKKGEKKEIKMLKRIEDEPD